MGAGQDIPEGGCSWSDLSRQRLSHIFPKPSPTPTCARSSRNKRGSGFLVPEDLLHRFPWGTHHGGNKLTNSRSLTCWSKAEEPALSMPQKVQSCQSFEKKNLERWADRRCRLGTSMSHMTARHRSPQGELRRRGRGSEEEPTQLSQPWFWLGTQEKTKTQACNWHCYFIISTSIIQ